MPHKTIQSKIRRLEESITKTMNPALEKADRTHTLIDHMAALEKARAAAKNLKLIITYEKRIIQAFTPPAIT